jgi:large subunit ribosomal protein L14
MIQPQTRLVVSDNTGAQQLVCICVLGGSVAKLRGIIIAVVKRASANIPIRRSEVVRAVVVRTRQRRQRRDGSCIRFDENAAVLVQRTGSPRGSRIFGPISRELRSRNLAKIISLAHEVILYFFICNNV